MSNPVDGLKLAAALDAAADNLVIKTMTAGKGSPKLSKADKALNYACAGAMLGVAEVLRELANERPADSQPAG